MNEGDELKKENRKLQNRIIELEQQLSIFQKDAVPRGYYVLNSIVNQQVDILSDFRLKDEIIKNPKDDKAYDRTKAIWEGMKGMITDLNGLKSELKLTGNQKADEKNVPFIETVAETRK